MAVLYSNNASSTLSASITSTATSLSVASGKGALFPAPTGGDYFYVTLVNTAGAIEIMKVTARSTDTLTVVRGQDGTTGVAWAAGDRVELRFTKGMLDDIKSERMPAAGPSTGSNGRILINASGNPVWSDTTFTYDAVLGSFRAANLRAAIGDSAPTWNFNNILHAGNYSSYALPLSGGSLTGKVIAGSSDGDSIEVRNDTASAASSGYITFKNKNGTGVYRPAARISGVNVDNAYDGDFLIETYSGGIAYKGLRVDENSNVLFYDTSGNVKFQWEAVNSRALINSNVVLHAGNYTSYSPSLTGTGASGTWAINISGSAAGASGANSLNNIGYGSGNLTWVQSSGAWQSWNSGWASHIISNHGDGSTYYNQTIIMPFWGPPQYMRKEGGTNVGPYTFLTTENYTNYTGAYVLKAGDTMSGKLGWGASMPNQKRIIGIYESGNLWTGIGMDAANAGVRIAGDGTSTTLMDVGSYSTDGAYTWTSRMLVNSTAITFSGSGIQAGTAAAYDNPGGWNANLVASGLYHARVRVKATSYNSSGDQETYLWVDNTVNPATGIYSTKSLFNFMGSISTVQVAGNTVLHAGNYTSYTDPRYMRYVGVFSGDWQTLTDSTGEVRIDQVNDITSGSHTNYPTGVYTYGGVMSWRGDNHSFQLYASHTGDLAYKSQWNNDNYTGWLKILTSANYTSYGDGRYVQKTGDTMTGALTTNVGGTSIFIGAQNVGTSNALRINWHTDSDLNYYIGKRAGTWTQPMDIAFYTGLRYHTHYSYGGHRFYTTGLDGTQAFSIGDGDNDVRLYSNFRLINGTSPYTSYFLWGDNTGWIFRFMTNVSGTATERFRFVDTGAFNAVGAITQNGNQVLHAGNYSSYALPLSGGTVTGTTTFSGTTYFNGVTYHTTTLDASGDLNLQGGSTGIGRFHIAATTGTTIVGGVSQSGTQTFGQSTVSHIVNIASGATSSANTKTVNIGTGGLSGAFTYLYLGSSSGTSYVNTYGTFTSYGTARVSKLSDHSYLQLNRSTTSYEAGLNFQTNGTTYWWNYTPSSSTADLNWYANGAIRMQLTNSGILYVNSNTVLHSANYSSYALPLTGGTVSGNIIPLVDQGYTFGASNRRWGNVYTNAVTFLDGTQQTTAAGAPSANTAIGAVVTAWANTATAMVQGQTIAGSSLYIANTSATLGANYLQFNATTPGLAGSFYTTVSNILTANTTVLTSGNVGYQNPPTATGITVLSGTWRLVSPAVPARSYSYDGYGNLTYSNMRQGIWVRVS